MAKTPLLRLSGVTRTYHDGTTDIHVLAGADLEIAPGEVVALVGPSGAGKSTLLHLAGLLERVQGGEVELEGVATSRLNDRRRTKMRRRQIGYVYQFHNLLPEFSALENVAMPLIIAGSSLPVSKARAAELLDLMGLADRVKHRPGALSGGEQQRVAIARAMANAPRMILADEPTGNLDPATSNTVFQALAKLIREQGSGGIIATHNYDLARKADRVVTLVDGRILPHDLSVQSV
ncbi:MAG: ABC transporter ATP-binding protein [Alphaproteobacteria bacterium]|nr:ABC transporter ATP-binding protein [Alphaproteobacteria bacterium]